MNLKPLVPLMISLALIMVAAVVASPPQQTDFDLTATAIIGNATATADAIDPAIRTQQAENRLATGQAVNATREVVIATGETDMATRTAIAITRDPLILSRTAVPILETATQLSINLTPTRTDEPCQFFYYRDRNLRQPLGSRLSSEGVPALVGVIGHEHASRSASGTCVESFVVIEVAIQITKPANDIISDVEIILSVLNEELPDDLNRVSHRTRLIIAWEWIPFDGSYNSISEPYPLYIDAEYRNAIEAYREGLRGEELLEALGGLTAAE